MDRPLGLTEHNYWLLSQAAPINVVVAARVRGAPPAERFVEALAWAQRQHPLLAARVVGGGWPRLLSAGVPTIPLEQVEQAGADDWQRAMEGELGRPFPWHSGPLAHVLLLRSGTELGIFCTFSHLIGDGLSGVYLMRDILRRVGAPDDCRTPYAERPSVEALMPAPGPTQAWRVKGDGPSAGDIAAGVAGVARGVGAAARDGRGAAGGWSHPAPGQRPRLTQRALPPDTTARLIARCRSERTSLHGALCAALLFANADEARRGATVALDCGSAVNARRHLTQDVGEEFGMYVAAVLTRHRVGPASTFWELARDVKRQLARDVASSDRLFTFSRWAGKALAHVKRPATAHRLLWLWGGCAERQLGVTNLGRLDLPERFGELELRELHFATTPQSASQVAIAAATFRGQLTCNFLYAEPPTAPATIEALSAAVMRRLQTAAA